MVTGVNSVNMTANVMSTTAVPAAVATHKESPPSSVVKSDRRSNKPIMEKRRRARINNCLNELKTLILDATKKDPARHSKLEKADILEKTVKHLQELQRQQAAMQQAADPKIINKFKAGFTDCANEVSRFPGLDTAVKRRLLQHLSNCINGVKTELHHHQRQAAAVQAQQLHAQMLPSPPSSPEQHDQQQHLSHLQQQQPQHVQPQQQTISPYMLSAVMQQSNGGYVLPNGLQVIPTKLPNGSIALVLPQSLPQQQQQQQQHILHQQQQQQLQQLQQQQQQIAVQMMSMPTRTASTSSASSSNSSNSPGCYERVMAASPTCNSNGSNSLHSYAPPSPANSYEAMDIKPSVIQHAAATVAHHQQYQNQQPLSLVVKKQIKEEEQPWRPW